MIARYSLPDMSAIWTDQAKYEAWLEVELAVCKSMAKFGLIPRETVDVIIQKASFDIARIEEIEAEVHHDMIAFLTSVAEAVGPEAQHIHRGMTSSDVLDTALALQLKKAGALLLEDLHNLRETLAALALQYKLTAMIGRTHGVHAEPITFGLKMARVYSEILRQENRLKSAYDQVLYGKISGVVGTFVHIEPRIEEDVCRMLGLKPEPAASQIVSRDRHAHWVSVLAGIGATLESLATEIRHLHRTEVGEVLEGFAQKQKGSSAMPHKRNPILCERICGMARLLRGHAVCALENVSLWHERDISHSSAERVMLPDSAHTLHYMLKTADQVLQNLDIRPEVMAANLGSTLGSIHSQSVLLALTDKGVSRDEAYQIIQKNALKSQESDSEFRDLLVADEEVSAHLSDEEISACFDLEKSLKRINEIFARLGLS
ncbi:adenylosuccinate lyase [candidate division LCP-89 bacterium B3_LCP]|uniref:Adenylosuccinate lyase n=1 Tax=candidate division LCP-89 bacterium B3_LCP TaxID=2012998 RepID=A0A532UZ67_UNCL8|nr:MAG: adenylosuccinate lyase [candidate division LCP-89 bacterium B3_LCP]